MALRREVTKIVPTSIGLQESHLCPEMHAMAKIAIFRVLWKIVSLTIFCFARDFFAVLCHVNNH